MEGALLGVPALSVSLQCAVGYFHILDPPEEVALSYANAAELAVKFCTALLSIGSPERTLLNINVPIALESEKPSVTRLGRRSYRRGSLRATGGPATYRTFGERNEPPPDVEDTPGTDFAAIRAGSVSVTPTSCVWDSPDGDPVLRWARSVCDVVHRDRMLTRRSCERPVELPGAGGPKPVR